MVSAADVYGTSEMLEAGLDMPVEERAQRLRRFDAVQAAAQASSTALVRFAS